MDDRGADTACEPSCCLETYRDAEISHAPLGVNSPLQKFVDTLEEYKFRGAVRTSLCVLCKNKAG